jgi:hypothetical protein
MTTAKIFFSFVAAALVLVGRLRMIRGGLEQIIPAAALAQSGVFIWMLVRGENPVDVTFRWIFFLALFRFLVNWFGTESLLLEPERILFQPHRLLHMDRKERQNSALPLNA